MKTISIAFTILSLTSFAGTEQKVKTCVQAIVSLRLFPEVSTVDPAGNPAHIGHMLRAALADGGLHVRSLLEGGAVNSAVQVAGSAIATQMIEVARRDSGESRERRVIEDELLIMLGPEGFSRMKRFEIGWDPWDNIARAPYTVLGQEFFEDEEEFHRKVRRYKGFKHQSDRLLLWSFAEQRQKAAKQFPRFFEAEKLLYSLKHWETNHYWEPSSTYLFSPDLKNVLDRGDNSFSYLLNKSSKDWILLDLFYDLLYKLRSGHPQEQTRMIHLFLLRAQQAATYFGEDPELPLRILLASLLVETPELFRTLVEAAHSACDESTEELGAKFEKIDESIHHQTFWIVIGLFSIAIAACAS